MRNKSLFQRADSVVLLISLSESWMQSWFSVSDLSLSLSRVCRIFLSPHVSFSHFTFILSLSLRSHACNLPSLFFHSSPFALSVFTSSSLLSLSICFSFYLFISVSISLHVPSKFPPLPHVSMLCTRLSACTLTPSILGNIFPFFLLNISCECGLFLSLIFSL